jgi:hypothetical protein
MKIKGDVRILKICEAFVFRSNDLNLNISSYYGTLNLYLLYVFTESGV